MFQHVYIRSEYTGPAKPFVFILFFFCLLSCSAVKKAEQQKPAASSIVFEPKKGAYESMRIPALVITGAGTLLAFCEGRISSSSDWADIDLLMRRSTNGGVSWEPYIVLAAHQGRKPTSNATPVVDKDGTIHLLFQRDYAAAYYTKSTDDGKTWTEPVDITYAFEAFRPEYDFKVLAPGPGHAIQLKSGRLLVPVWLSNPDQVVPQRSHFPSRMLLFTVMTKVKHGKEERWFLIIFPM